MTKIEDRIGQRFESNNGGLFEVIGLERDKWGKTVYKVRFDHSGYETVAEWQQICAGNVRNPFYPVYHGAGYLGEASRSHPFWSRWQQMLARCYSPEHQYYPDYGGRGIKVDPELHNFENYIALLETLDGHDDPELDTIDRIDNDKGYKPGNLRWASMKEQRANRRRLSTQRDFIATDPDGVEYLGKSQAGFARRHGLHQGHLNSCLNNRAHTHKGWTFRYRGCT